MDASSWFFIIFLIAITTFPVKVAAEFVGAKNNTLKHSAISVFFATIITIFLIYFFGNKAETYLVSFLLIVMVFKNVLLPPPGYNLWLAILALTIQLGVISAIASYGKYTGSHFLLMIS